MTDQHSGPFIGPRPYTHSDSLVFFGRGREARDLSSLIVANQVVVLYGPVGVGKTSLLNAGLIPRLKAEDFQILPTVRLTTQAFDTKSKGNPGANIFVESALRSLMAYDTAPSGARTIDECLKSLPRQVDNVGWTRPRIVIIDQCEELFMHQLHDNSQSHYAACTEFLRQLAEAVLSEKMLRVLLVVREGSLGALASGARLLPYNLDTRYCLYPLDSTRAVEVLRAGAQAFGRSFASGVAERIVASIEAPSEHMIGSEVSPVLLQVTGSAIWQRLEEDVVTITEYDMRAGSEAVESALQEYYDHIVRAVAAKKMISEAKLREWIERELFRNDFRLALAAGATTTAGMPNEVLNELSINRLLREINRGGVLYYEILHERLIRPIRQSNKAWRMGSWERIKRAFLSVLGRSRLERSA
jgi:hypothetical protein